MQVINIYLFINKDTFKYVSENTDVAIIKYNKSYFSNSCIIEAVNSGETYIYVENQEGTIQSEKIKVMVQLKKNKDDIYADKSRKVYIAPYGKKFHIRQSCAGGNSSPTTKKSIVGIYDPCKKCAQ